MSGRVGFRTEQIEEYQRLQKMLDEATSESVNPPATTVPTTECLVDEAKAQRPAHINPKRMRNQSDVQRDALAPRNPNMTGQRTDGSPALVGSKRTKQDYDDRPEDEIARKNLNQNKARNADSTTGVEAVETKHESLEKSYESAINLVEQLRVDQQNARVTDLPATVQAHHGELYKNAITEIGKLRKQLIATKQGETEASQPKYDKLYEEAVGLVEELREGLKLAQTHDASGDIPVTTKASPQEVAQRATVESMPITDPNITQVNFSWEEYGSEFQREYAEFMREYADGLIVESGEASLRDNNSTKVFSVVEQANETTPVILR